MSGKTANVWDRFQADFNAMTDSQIRREVDRCEEMIEEAEDWIEAVAAWEAAGRPRAPETDNAE